MQSFISNGTKVPHDQLILVGMEICSSISFQATDVQFKNEVQHLICPMLLSDFVIRLQSPLKRYSLGGRIPIPRPQVMWRRSSTFSAGV